MRLVESASTAEPAVLYHGTDRANVLSIMVRGIDPRFDQTTSDAVYLTDDLGKAERYASGEYHASRCNSSPAIFSVDLSKLDHSKLSADAIEMGYLLDGDDDGELPDKEPADFSWQESLQHSGQVAYRGLIPVHALRRVR